MSRDTQSICRQCGVYEPGFGLNYTLLDCYPNVAEFDAGLWERFGMTPFQLDPQSPNYHIRAFLVRHHGHPVEYWSTDWIYGDDDPLEGLTPEYGEDRVIE